MGDFKVNMLGVLFHSGVDTLRAAFRHSIDGIDIAWAGIDQKLSEYLDILERGGEWIGERDDEGHVLWDQQALLEIDMRILEDSKQTVRKAFTVSAYHHWEKFGTKLTGKDNSRHANIVSELEKRGLSLHPDLKILHALVNTLKHSNKRWGFQLQDLRGHLFNTAITSADSHVDWADAVHLNDDDVYHFFEVAQKSGPPSDILATSYLIDEGKSQTDTHVS